MTFEGNLIVLYLDIICSLYDIEFANAFILLSRNQPDKAITDRDRLSYSFDHNNPTPGNTTKSFSFKLSISYFTSISQAIFH